MGKKVSEMTELPYLSGSEKIMVLETPGGSDDPKIVRADNARGVYITSKATPTRVTAAAPDALGEYRSYLRNAGARTYTETNGSPTTAPDSTNGYKLYNGNAYASADTNNEPSKYEVFIGTGKTPVFEFYKNTGRTGLICTDIFPNWAGSNDVGCATGYDPVTGIAFVTIIQNGNQCAPGVDENGVAVIADIYFDIKC